MRQPTDGKKKKMPGRKIYAACFVALALLILLVGGCNGVLYEKQKDNGQVERLCMDQGETWGSYKITPRYSSQIPTILNDLCIMLRTEQTF